MTDGYFNMGIEITGDQEGLTTLLQVEESSLQFAAKLTIRQSLRD